MNQRKRYPIRRRVVLFFRPVAEERQQKMRSIDNITDDLRTMRITGLCFKGSGYFAGLLLKKPGCSAV